MRERCATPLPPRVLRHASPLTPLHQKQNLKDLRHTHRGSDSRGGGGRMFDEGLGSICTQARINTCGRSRGRTLPHAKSPKYYTTFVNSPVFRSRKTPLAPFPTPSSQMLAPATLLLLCAGLAAASTASTASTTSTARRCPAACGACPPPSSEGACCVST